MSYGEYLENLGFSKNEAKVYTVLLKHKLLNGYEIAKLSGVPRSMVYEVINRMVGKGILLKLEGDPNYYKPLEYDKLIRRIKAETESSINRAEEFLKGLAGEEDSQDYVLNIVGFDKFIKKAAAMIDGAKEEISLSVWSSELELMRKPLKRAVERGVRVYIFTFEDVELEGAVIFSYRISDASGLFPYRRMTLVVDNYQCLNGENSGEKSIFIYTKNHAVLSLATDEIVLNIFWYKFMEGQGMLGLKNTSGEFLRIIEKLGRELDINENMAKNLTVYNFQRRKEDENEGR